MGFAVQCVVVRSSPIGRSGAQQSYAPEVFFGVEISIVREAHPVNALVVLSLFFDLSARW